MRLASTSTVASSGTRPPSTTPSAASQAASKPEDSLARPIDLSVRLLPAESIRSIPPTSPGGMSRLIVDSPKALGLAMMAGTSERGFRTAGPSPKALGRTATRRPRSARISTVDARMPTSRLRPCQAGPATYSRPSAST